jgi:predicted ATPase
MHVNASDLTDILALLAADACVSTRQISEPRPRAGGQGTTSESGTWQLARILRSPIFASAPSLNRFLTYLVEQTLQANPKPLNEYSLGIDVFNRGETFDPATDTIVRVQARRLRSKLEKYYASEGQVDPIVIELPKGQYRAVLRATSVGDLGATSNIPPESSGLVDRMPDLRRIRTGLPHPLPLPADCASFVGREKELADVKRLLLCEHTRLLTLAGAGGSGKTRLALRAAAEIKEEFAGGVYMVALASITDPRTVPSTIAQIVGLRHTGGTPVSEVLPLYLGFLITAPTLLVLDNFEQVVAAAPLLSALLAGCSFLKILVTSRALLDLSGEYEYSVSPLVTPDPRALVSLEELIHNPAVALFTQRAVATNPVFVLNECQARAVAQICSRLDGLPLAIELAAARTKIFPPLAMLARLSNPLDFLISGHRDLPSRQQTLRRTIDWSYGLLSPIEQTLFRRLAVFAGGCTLESLEAVCNTRRDLGIDALESITSLVNQNLLQCKNRESQEARFTMLQTIREFALELLNASGEEEFTRRAHAAYCIVLSEQGAAQVAEEDRAQWLIVWDAEYDNLRAALDWLIESGRGAWALRLATALFAFWERREHLAEGRERLEAVLSMKSAALPTRERARAAWYAGIFADKQGDYGRAIRLHEESLHIYRELDDRKGVAAQLGYLAHELHQSGNVAEACTLFRESLIACRQLGDRAGIATALSNFAEFLTNQKDYALAWSLLQEALALFREIGNESGVGWSLNHLGDVALGENKFGEASHFYRQGHDVFRRIGNRWGVARSFADLAYLASEQNDQEGARASFVQALQTFIDLGHTRGVARALEGLACVAVRQGDVNEALVLCAAAEGIRQRVGAPQRPAERAKLERILEPGWRARDQPASNAIWAESLRMPLEAAIRRVLN